MNDFERARDDRRDTDEDRRIRFQTSYSIKRLETSGCLQIESGGIRSSVNRRAKSDRGIEIDHRIFPILIELTLKFTEAHDEFARRNTTISERGRGIHPSRPPQAGHPGVADCGWIRRYNFRYDAKWRRRPLANQSIVAQMGDLRGLSAQRILAQLSCRWHQQAEHMPGTECNATANPPANPEPSTRGTTGP